jgi:hypothetical protein
MTPERPVYFEGQILAAADLTSAVDYGRAQVARHERYLHSWGIAEGLGLTTTSKTNTGGNKYVEVTLDKGVAIDGTGREIVVPQPVLLTTTGFTTANPSALANTDYPILLHGTDSTAPAAPLTNGACGAAGQPTRTQEGFALTYGAPGAEIDLDQQKVPDESAGPAPDVAHPWEILVGHVRWDPSITNFVSATITGRRYAGVMADTVAARSGTLALQSQPTATPGQPVLIVGGDPPFKFGLYKGGTDVDPRLWVTAAGDVTATGTIKGALSPITPGEIRVQSGTATDGVIIPLPAGITEDQVTKGGVILHVHLTPHTPQSTTGSSYAPVTCNVDTARRLHCLVQITGAPSPQPGTADYLLVATAVSSTGANP